MSSCNKVGVCQPNISGVKTKKISFLHSTKIFLSFIQCVFLKRSSFWVATRNFRNQWPAENSKKLRKDILVASIDRPVGAVGEEGDARSIAGVKKTVYGIS